MLDDRDIIVPFIGFHLLSDFLPGKCLSQPSHLLFAREDFLWFPDKIVMPQKQFDSFHLRLFLVFPMESWWRRQWHPLQYSCLENPMDGGAWWAAVQGVAKSQTQLSDFTFTFQFHALEKEMATYSIVLAWRIPGTGEPGGLPSIGSHRVGHD